MTMRGIVFDVSILLEPAAPDAFDDTPAELDTALVLLLSGIVAIFPGV